MQLVNYLVGTLELYSDGFLRNCSRDLIILYSHLHLNWRKFVLFLIQSEPVTARSNASVCDRSLAWIMGSNPAGGRAYLSLVGVVYCLVKVAVSGS